MITKSYNRPDVSFIMPAYNSEKYISDPIRELQKENKINWELIIIDDFSEDRTLEVVKSFKKKDKRIKIFRNIKKGKVAGLNYGFNKSNGKIIKFVDSDDILSVEYFKFFNKLKKYHAHCHNAFITDNELNIISKYIVNPLIIFTNYKYVLTKLITCPKAFWSFDRKIAKKIFPMPNDLPFEDVWINLIIKKHSKSIYHIKKSIYKYRQHKNQTFGGQLNFSEKKVIFRARRMLKLIKVLKKEPRIIYGFEKNIFKNITSFFQLMSSKRLSYFDILISKQNFSEKLKLIIYKKIPTFAKYALYIKWKIDEISKSLFK